MGANHNHSSPSEPDPQILAEAQRFWNDFTKMSAAGIVAVVVLLLAMAVFLV